LTTAKTTMMHHITADRLMKGNLQRQWKLPDTWIVAALVWSRPSDYAVSVISEGILTFDDAFPGYARTDVAMAILRHETLRLMHRTGGPS